MKTKNKPVVSIKYDTKVDVIQKKYNIDLGVSAEKKLGDFLYERGYKSMAKMLKDI